MTDLPDGFKPHFRQSKFTDPWEPLYSRVDDGQVSIGTILRDVHCNSRGFAHGAFLAAIADNAMGLSCHVILKTLERDTKGLVTVNMSTDYVGSAQLGAWLQTDSTVLKTGGSLCFTNCTILSNDQIVVRANATFRILR